MIPASLTLRIARLAYHWHVASVKRIGANIKRLQGEFSDFYRYRLGDYRLFYTIDEEDTVVIVADLRSRQASYRRR